MTLISFPHADRRIAARPWRSAIITTLIVWHHRHRTRRQLRDLDARALLDVGIDPQARHREVSKWCWQP
jgi:uncharacterized protein YjiS (DUF1127 family)